MLPLASRLWSNRVCQQVGEREGNAKAGSPRYGILQSMCLLERAEIKTFESTFTITSVGTFTDASDLLMKLAATAGKEMHHTNRDTLRLVERIPPSAASE